MRVLLVTLFITLISATAEAQVLAYGVAGPAGASGFIDINTTFHAAGGAEGIIGDRLGIGGEFGFFDRLMVASGNATLHLGALPASRATGFVTGGYSRLGIGDGEGAFSAFNIGAGAHVWFGEHAGLRIEFRDHIRTDDRGNTQYWSIRAGVAFR